MPPISPSSAFTPSKSHESLCFGKVGGSVWESNPPYLYGVPLDLKSRQATRPDPLPERTASSTLV